MSLPDQPPPSAHERGKPMAWDAVRLRFQDLIGEERLACPPHVAVSLDADMVARDRLGHDRYGVRLQPNNGRDNLIDAQQELLDACAYLANEALQSQSEDEAAELDCCMRMTLRSLVRVEMLRQAR